MCRSIDDLKQMDCPTITPAVAAQYLGCDPHWLRLMARERPEQLGFPTCCIRSRVKIPRIPFIKFLSE